MLAWDVYSYKVLDRANIFNKTRNFWTKQKGFEGSTLFFEKRTVFRRRKKSEVFGKSPKNVNFLRKVHFWKVSNVFSYFLFSFIISVVLISVVDPDPHHGNLNPHQIKIGSASNNIKIWIRIKVVGWMRNRIRIRINLHMTKPKCMEYEPICALFQ